MKINNIRINGFGKIQNREIKLEDGINIIYGENESGKTTLLNFIKSMFYGISKNKNGKDISDYDKFKPWNSEEYSGKIEYELDNENKYEVFRDFNKRLPKIYNENLEEVSKEFNIDKNRGNQFFVEQTGIDADMFLSSAIVPQQEIKIEKQERNAIIQKIANLSTTGSDNVSYKRVIDKLNKKTIEEIGNSRTSQRPINIIEKDLYKLKKEKEELEEYNEKKYEVEDQRKKIIIELENQKRELEIARKIKKANEKIDLEKEKIKINNQLVEEIENKIEILQKEKLNKKEMFEQKNKNRTKNNIILACLMIMNLILVICLKDIISKIIFILIAAMFLIIGLVKEIEKNKLKRGKEENKYNYNILNEEADIVKDNLNQKKSNMQTKELDIKELHKQEMEKIKKDYRDKVVDSHLNELFEEKNIEDTIESLERHIQENNIILHNLDLDWKNIIPKLENLALIEEKIQDKEEQYVELQKTAESIELAKNIFECAYRKMKKNITPRLTENLSDNISKISNGKYNNVKINNENEIIIEISNGDYIQAEALSMGTIDQLYLSLRLAILKEISEESIPIILDESFAYYDEKRLTNILKYLNENLYNQIVIFTCTNREKNLLNKLDIKYNLIQI